MPVLAMAEPVVDHQKQFQAAVDVIQNLPKNGCYRPSYEVMLRFYSLYKQAVCGPCTVPRPGFWDPVGRYKWDAWSHLGDMSREGAMAAYVDEMKKVAQEVIDTMPMNEKTASLFHHFEPLYRVIDDMPKPPESLLKLREDRMTGSLTKTTENQHHLYSSVDHFSLIVVFWPANAAGFPAVGDSCSVKNL